MAYGGRQTGLRWIGRTTRTTIRPIIVVSTAAFCLLPDSVVFFLPDNRAIFGNKKITGDVVSPEFQIQGQEIGWLSNRARIRTVKVQN